MTASLSPPPWPIPPTWQVALPPREPDSALPGSASSAMMTSTAAVPSVGEADVGAPSSRVVALLVSGGSERLAEAPPPPPEVAVDVRAVAAPVAGFPGVHALARAAAQALGEGAHGVVIAHDAVAPAETGWALDLIHEGAAPVVLTGGAPADLPDAVAVAASGLQGLGCTIVARGEIHAARYAVLTGSTTPVIASPAAGPLGHVAGGIPRLLWRPPERFTVRGPFAGRAPRVGLYVVTLGDDGELLGALARHCDGLVVAAPAAAGVLDPLGPALAEVAARVPVVLTSPVDAGEGFATTTLDPPKARVLLHLLLDAGHDRTGVLNAFAALGHGASVPS